MSDEKNNDVDDTTGHPEDEVDGCVCDIELGEDEATNDEDLPPSSGGVEG